MTKSEAKKKHGELSEEIERHNYAYYVENKPVVSDQAFDKLLRQLIDLAATESASDTTRHHASQALDRLLDTPVNFHRPHIISLISGASENPELLLPILSDLILQRPDLFDIADLDTLASLQEKFPNTLLLTRLALCTRNATLRFAAIDKLLGICIRMASVDSTEVKIMAEMTLDAIDRATTPITRDNDVVRFKRSMLIRLLNLTQSETVQARIRRLLN